uniref:Neurotransmitter-gated ion-channel transmembrane domain-containing protein n=1 Tax=Parascaris equorum TaxID=6256 RepID=A0A914RJY9_PAREQ
MTTLMTTTNAAMPKVSYVKSIDIFLGVCFLMVFSALLEYAAVGYIGKRMKLVTRKKSGRIIARAQIETGLPNYNGVDHVGSLRVYQLWLFTSRSMSVHNPTFTILMSG